MHSSNTGKELTGSAITAKMSSAYISSLCSLPPACTPFIPSSALIARASGSRAKVNNRGDREQPCLVPLDRSKKLDITPFVRTAALGFE